MCCDKSNYKKMTSGQNVVVRASIVLGMVAAVVTILYFTPMPDQNFKSCDRPCHDLDWPMICRIKLTIELYQTITGKCENCPNNATNCNKNFCPSIEASSRGIITANRLLPGPTIQVCQNDVLVIDVINKIPSHSLTIHWRGQPNHEAPFMDGVPMVTQCPISSYTTFQYKFRASRAGTHFYHAHDDLSRSNGLFGALIVKQADKIEPHRKLYDIDSKEHVITISEWSNDFSESSNQTVTIPPKTILINGKTTNEFGLSNANFDLKKGKRYRFRIIYTSGNVGCPVTLTIDDHLMKVIALDGNPTNPYEASSVSLTKGERLDFVLKANQEIGDYFLRVKSNCNGNHLQALASINYEGMVKEMRKTSVEENAKLVGKVRHFDTLSCESKIGNVCLGDVRSVDKISKELKQEQVERKIYLGFNFITKNNNGDYYDDLRSKIYQMNNLTFTYPSSPLLTQLNDIPQNLLCNDLNVPDKCVGKNICECVHLEHIPLGMTTEILLIDQGGDEDEHIFHLHGHAFFVVGAKQFDSPQEVDAIKKLDENNSLFKRNVYNPVLKDTVRVSRNSVVAVRFIANNPGFWILRDEQSRGWTKGMDIVFQVGDIADMVATPSNFPTCGSFIGPDFFLI